MKLLILCTGNSCRSQMAEGFLKSFDKRLQVFSAGTEPAAEIHPMAVKVMKEKNIDLSAHNPEKVDKYLNKSFDYVITVCDDAREKCPVFVGEVKHMLHLGFADPAKAVGSQAEILGEFRRIRDEIQNEFYEFYKKHLKDEN